MTTPEQPAAPALTRKQIREIRNTGAQPIIVPEAAPEAAAPPAPAPASEPAPPVAPLARAAEPIVVPDPPVPDAAVDLGVSPLTRRQARQQERIRTASVPVITPEIAAAHAASFAPAPLPAAVPVSASAGADTGFSQLFGGLQETHPEPERTPAPAWIAAAAAAPVVAAPPAEEPDPVRELFPGAVEAPTGDVSQTDAAAPVVSPLLGAGLLAAESADTALPASFDQLLARPASGSLGIPNAIIVSQASGESPIIAPVAATGEVLITGTLNLPEGLGSNGHAPGVTDGKDVDAALIDGEIPAHSSPTPIAASAAISTVKNSGEIIKPPAPEKGSKLMMTLAITAGALALALVGVLILAFATGVF